jgi:hypothetical protein
MNLGLSFLRRRRRSSQTWIQGEGDSSETPELQSLHSELGAMFFQSL